MALISCRDLVLAYDGKEVVRNLSMNVNSGDYLCIIGENGSGKSTLMKGLLGLKKPVSGDIIYGDGLKQNEIGYIPQQTVVQRDFPASVYEDVISGCVNRMGLKPFYTAKEKKIALDNLERLGISTLRKSSYKELSGGQQQRVLLARALCATKKLLLLDEPVAGLDPVVTAELYDIIKSINKEDGITVIMVSHDISGVISSATHILHLAHSAAFCGTKDDYLLSDTYKGFLGGDVK